LRIFNSENQRATNEIKLAIVIKDASIKEKDPSVSKKDALISEKDAAIHEKDMAIGEKDAAITEKNAAIHNKDTAIQDRDASIREKDAWISKKDAVIHDKDTTIREKDALICDKDAWISNKGAIICEKDTVIKEKDKSIKEKDAAIHEKEAAITKLQSFMQRAEDESRRVRADLDDSITKRLELTSEIDSLKSSIEGQEQVSFEKNLTVSKLQGALQEARKESPPLRTQLAAMRTRSIEQEREAGTRNTKIETLELDLRTKEADIKELNDELNNFNRVIRGKDKLLSQQLTKAATLERKITRLTLQNTNLALSLAEYMPNGELEHEDLYLERPPFEDSEESNEGDSAGMDAEEAEVHNEAKAEAHYERAEPSQDDNDSAAGEPEDVSTITDPRKLEALSTIDAEWGGLPSAHLLHCPPTSSLSRQTLLVVAKIAKALTAREAQALIDTARRARVNKGAAASRATASFAEIKTRDVELALQEVEKQASRKRQRTN
jgi:chromosome segregation ATPase